MLPDDHPDLARIQAIMVEALIKYRERDAYYRGIWKQSGAEGVAFHIRSKAQRIVTMGGQADLIELMTPHLRETQLLDDAIDLAVLAAMYIDNVRQGRYKDETDI